MIDKQKTLSDYWTKEVKEVQKKQLKQLGSPNLDLSIYLLLKAGLNPARICQKLNLSKTNVDYYLSSLKQRKLITKIGYATYEILDKYVKRSPKKTTRVATRQLEEVQILTSDKVRGHAFQFVLRLPKNLRNWNKRETIFNNINFKYQPLILGGIVRGQKIMYKGRKVWLTDKSIVIYEKASYIADTAQESKDYAISNLISVVKALESQLQADFSFAGNYKFKVSRQHYALIKNALARQYDKEGKKLEIYTDRGLWFLIDNSFNLHEAETVHPRTAVDDNEKVQNFFNSLKTNPITTNEINSNFNELSEMIKKGSELQIGQMQVTNQIEQNLLKLTKIVYDIGGKK